MTPLEFHFAVEGYNQRQEEALQLVYIGAAWQRCKKMPSTSKIFKTPKKQMTDEQMLKIVEELNTAFGGEDRRRKDGSSKEPDGSCGC